MAEKDNQQRGEQLINERRRQPGQPAEIGAGAGVGKRGGVLPVAFQEQGLPGDRVQARIEGGQRRGRAKHVMAVMHHAMRVPVRLGKKGAVGGLLLMPSFMSLLGGAQRGKHRGAYQQDEKQH